MGRIIIKLTTSGGITACCPGVAMTERKSKNTQRKKK
uniref:Uncharacterized protein n=1 Tax=Rhizophora mucronata TaxID=61149 RepID=A0A2P2LUM6_RHIMU